MFNAQQPSHEELPTSAELLRSTLIAAVAAVVILVSIVLPAEYAIDPTGLGRAIGLTEMGEIKQQLEEEADDHSSLIEGLEGEALDILAGFVQLFVGSAHAQDINSAEMTLILANGESAEIKIDLSKGQEASGSDVTITVKTEGPFTELKRMK